MGMKYPESLPYSNELVKEIVRLHDEEFLSIVNIAKRLQISKAILLHCTKNKWIIFEKSKEKLISEKGKGKRHSEEMKKRISESRKRYLQEHPDQVPYKLNHYSKGESYAEKYFREWLEKENIQYIAQQQVGLYSLDFLVGNIDLEIDGEQHYVDDRVSASDERRTEYVESQGFKVIRIRWSYYQKLTQEEKQEYLERLKIALTTDNKLNDNFAIEENKIQRIKGYCKHCGKPVFNKGNIKYCSAKCQKEACFAVYKIVKEKFNNDFEAFKSELKKDIETIGVCATGRKFGVGHTAIGRWRTRYLLQNNNIII